SGGRARRGAGYGGPARRRSRGSLDGRGGGGRNRGGRAGDGRPPRADRARRNLPEPLAPLLHAAARPLDTPPCPQPVSEDGAGHAPRRPIAPVAPFVRPPER